jgi:hypothetical protein
MVTAPFHTFNYLQRLTTLPPFQGSVAPLLALPSLCPNLTDLVHLVGAATDIHYTDATPTRLSPRLNTYCGPIAHAKLLIPGGPVDNIEVLLPRGENSLPEGVLSRLSLGTADVHHLCIKGATWDGGYLEDISRSFPHLAVLEMQSIY